MHMELIRTGAYKGLAVTIHPPTHTHTHRFSGNSKISTEVNWYLDHVDNSIKSAFSDHWAEIPLWANFTQLYFNY